MTYSPMGMVSNAWDWSKEHWYFFVIGALVLVAAFFLYRWWKQSQEEELRRHATERAMKEVFGSANAAGAGSRKLVTRGNAATRATTWTHIYGVRETSHAYFIYGRPDRGLFKWFQRRRHIIARHLVADSHSENLEVVALGMTPYEGIWIPDDDFQDPEIVDRWREVLIESKMDLAAVDRDLPSCVLAWYLRIMKAETYSRTSIRSFDDTAWNWHASSSAPLTTKKAPSYESPSITNDRQDREAIREQEANQNA